MKYAAVSLVAAAGSAAAAVGNVQVAYGQCGGENYSGPTSCTSGWHCTSYNPYYYQCVTGAGPTAVASAPPAATSSPAAAKTTLTTKPSAAPTSVSTTLSTPAAAPKPVASSLSSPAVPSSAAPTTTAPAPAATTTSAAAPAAATTTSAAAAAPAASGAASSGKVKYAGVNISGFDFGCSIDGTCTISSVANPGTTGASQMTHFVSQTGLNAFRLPVAWQYLVNNNLGGTLDATNFGNYDTLVQNCIKAGAALCIVDIHNYARWNGNVIGQSNGAVTDAQFTSLWSQLATKYAGSATVAFGIMNEPQGLPSVPTWGQTVQKAVTAIRQAGAKNNMILLPGNDFTHASTYISDGSYAALSNITNLDGSKTNLVFDVHQYLDSDGSGTHANCVTNNVAAFTTLATQLRTDKRQALLSETGGGPTDATCLTNVCQELQYLASNSDVYLGWTGWAAGEFDTSYVLTETPMGSPGAYTDQQLVTQCIAGAFKGTSTA